ncbi:MAG TPA: sigma factor, partial [Acidimicrobiia bacterium]
MPADRSDGELIAASRRDPLAFAPIFERHFATVHGYLARRGGRMRADELVGEVFRIAFEQRDRYDESYGDARPWLLGIATRLWWRAARQGERTRRAYERAAYEARSVERQYEEADDRLEAVALRARLADAIDALAPGDR